MDPSSPEIGLGIKPPMEPSDGIRLVREEYGLEVEEIAELDSYDDRNYHVIAKSSSNPFITDVSASGFTLKITNSCDSKNPDCFIAQNELLVHLRSKSIPVPRPLQTLNGEYITKMKWNAKDDNRVFLVRLMEYLPGEMLKDVPASLPLYRDMGFWLAKLDDALKVSMSALCVSWLRSSSHTLVVIVRLEYILGRMLKDVPASLPLYRDMGFWFVKLDDALKSYDHPIYHNHTSVWHLKSCEKALAYLDAVKNNQRRALVRTVLDKYNESIVKQYSQLEHGLIHGDYNEQNIIVGLDASNQWRLSAVIDFGDANYACYLYEVAAATAYMMLEARRNEMDIFIIGKEFLKGYESVRSLPDLERSLLKTAICTRLCQSLVLGLHSLSGQQDNQYIGSTQVHGWDILEELWSTPDEHFNSLLA